MPYLQDILCCCGISDKWHQTTASFRPSSQLSPREVKVEPFFSTLSVLDGGLRLVSHGDASVRAGRRID